MERAVEDAPHADLAADRTTVRARVTDALGDEAFVAAVRRRTDGALSSPETSETRFETVTDLPGEPFDQSAVRTELLVFSSTHLYRWVVAGGTVDLTRLPRTPAAAGIDR